MDVFVKRLLTGISYCAVRREICRRIEEGDMRAGEFFGGIGNDLIDARISAKGQGIQIAGTFETFTSGSRIRQFQQTIAEPILTLRVIAVECGGSLKALQRLSQIASRLRRQAI